MLRRKIRRVGNSLVFSMPSQILEALEIKDGDHVIIKIIDDLTVCIQKYMKKGEQ